MNVFTFFLLAFIGFSEAAEKLSLCDLAKQTELSPKGIWDEILVGLVESFRQTLKDGDPEKGIPSFDPFVEENLQLTPNLTLLNGIFKLERLEIQDIPNFLTEKAQVKPGISLSIELVLNFPSIKVLGMSYEGALNIFNMVNIFGAGDLLVDIKGFKVDIKAKASLLGKLKKIDLTLVVPVVEAKITGLLNDEYMSAIISKQLSATLTQILKQEKDRIEKVLNCLAKEILLKKFETMGDGEQCQRNMENYWKEIKKESEGGDAITKCLVAA